MTTLMELFNAYRSASAHEREMYANTSVQRTLPNIRAHLDAQIIRIEAEVALHNAIRDVEHVDCAEYVLPHIADECRCCGAVLGSEKDRYEDEDGNQFCDIRCWSEWSQRADDAAQDRALDSRMEQELNQ